MLKNLALALALPPMCFLYLVMAGAMIPPRRGVGRALIWVGLTGLVALSLPVVSDLLIFTLEQGLLVRTPMNAAPQAIVILGGDVARSGRSSESTRPGHLTLDRLHAGAELHRRTNLPILVTGGSGQIDYPPVATVMADSLRKDFHLRVEWTENASFDTWENAVFSAEILKKQGITSVYVVTHGWHMRRAMLAFQKAGMTVTPAPTSIDAPSGSIWTDYVPRISAWQYSYFAIHEWVGCAWYAFR